MGVGGDQSDPGQAAGGQRAQEGQPARAVLGGGDLNTEDLSVALGVDPGGNQGVYPDDSADFTDLERQRVGGDECVRSGVEQAGRNAPTASSSSLAIDCHCQRSRGWRGGAWQAAEPQGSEYRPTGL